MHNLGQILSVLEKAANKSNGSTAGPLIPPMSPVWEFFFGTGNDQNLARLVEFYEGEHGLIQEFSTNTWSQKTGVEPQVRFSEFYSQLKIT